MRIGLKEPVDEDHLEHGIRRTRGEDLAIEARLVDGRQIVAADALDVLLHIHRAARPFPVDAWHEHVEIIGKIAGEAFGVACLYCEIEFPLQRSAQLAYNVDGPVAAGLGCLPLGEMGKVLEDAQIGVDFRRDAGSANLQDDRRAAGERGPMDLGNRSGGVWLAVQTGKDLERRAAERLLDLRQQIIERHRRHFAEKLVELLSPRRWQKVFPGREYLAQLDEGRPQFLQGEPGPLLRFEIGHFGGLSPLQDLTGTLEQRRDAGATYDIPEAVANEDRADLSQAWQLAGHTEHPEHHCVSYVPLFASDWSRSASATPARRPLKTNVIRALASRTVAIPGAALMAPANWPSKPATRALASTPTFWALDGKLRHFAPEVGGHRLPDTVRRSRVILFQPSQADQRFLQVVVGEILSA